MPTVNICHPDFVDKIGDLTTEQVDSLCWSYGLELDDVTSEYEIVKKEQGEEKAANCSRDAIYKIDIPANRYDLLCCEGLTRALMIFEDQMRAPHFVLKPKVANAVMTIDPSTQVIRPFCVAAILRNLTFTNATMASFIALQDKLHQNIGKKRYIVSIGTHDYDTIQGPFLYTAKKPNEIAFVPLNETKEFTAAQLMVHYSKESHLKPYLPIIRDSEVYPVIYDSNGVVLSMPPIINGDHSRIKVTTRNVLIEITGTNFHKISVALDTLVTMFSEYCDDKFSVEPVEMRRPDGSVYQTPELSYRSENVSVDYINKTIGTSLAGDEIAKLLDRMSLTAELIRGSNGSVLSVTVPPTRHDIIHRCDIAEDVAIAYGYDNVPEPKTVSISGSGGDTPLSRLTDEVRLLMVKQGFAEALSFVLCSRDDVSTKLGRQLAAVPAVHIGNPKTPEFQVARTDLLPGIINTIQSNQHLALPLRLFEVQDVVRLNAAKDVGAGNLRMVCAVHFGTVPDFEGIYNVMTTVMQSLGCRYHDDNDIDDDTASDKQWRKHVTATYKVDEVEDSMLMPGRSFRISLADGRDIGRIGILKTSVLKNFGLKKGLASMFEFQIEPFL